MRLYRSKGNTTRNDRGIFGTFALAYKRNPWIDRLNLLIFHTFALYQLTNSIHFLWNSVYSYAPANSPIQESYSAIWQITIYLPQRFYILLFMNLRAGRPCYSGLFVSCYFCSWAMNYTYKQIWLINFPVMMSILMEQLINITDAVFLGHVGEVELGASAIAGIYYLAVYMLSLIHIWRCRRS